MRRQYAIFYLEGDPWTSWRFFGLWSGDSPLDAINKSNVSEAHGLATKLATIPWDQASIFGRSGWSAIKGDDGE